MATVYSGISFAEPNNLQLWGADVGHTYNSQAPTREKLYTVNGHECLIQFPPKMDENWLRNE